MFRAALSVRPTHHAPLLLSQDIFQCHVVLVFASFAEELAVAEGDVSAGAASAMTVSPVQRREQRFLTPACIRNRGTRVLASQVVQQD